MPRPSIGVLSLAALPFLALIALLITPAPTQAGNPSIDGVWSKLSNAYAAPRWGGSLVYDSRRHRLVLFAGGGRNDTWVFPLSGTPVWTQLTTNGMPPPARANHVAVYDPVRDGMFIQGGADGSVVMSDVWLLSFSTNTWFQVTPGTFVPGSRTLQAAAFDPFRKEMLIFGGYRPCQNLNDIWAFSPAGLSWRSMTPASPPSERASSKALFDARRNRLLLYFGCQLFCGGPPDVCVADLWSFEAPSQTWTQLAPSGTRPPFDEGYAVFFDVTMDSRRDRMLLSGWNGNGMEIYSLDLAIMAWSRLAPDGPVPPLHDLVFYDAAGDRMIAVGGADTFGSGETWVLSFAGRTAVGDDAPPAVAKLYGASPNPFTSKVAIEFDLARRGQATLAIFDLSGRLVRSVDVSGLGQGHRSVSWTGRDDSGELVPSGIYFIRLDATGVVATTRIVFMRN